MSLTYDGISYGGIKSYEGVTVQELKGLLRGLDLPVSGENGQPVTKGELAYLLNLQVGFPQMDVPYRENNIIRIKNGPHKHQIAKVVSVGTTAPPIQILPNNVVLYTKYRVSGLPDYGGGTSIIEAEFVSATDETVTLRRRKFAEDDAGLCNIRPGRAYRTPAKRRNNDAYPHPNEYLKYPDDSIETIEVPISELYKQSQILVRELAEAKNDPVILAQIRKQCPNESHSTLMSSPREIRSEVSRSAGLTACRLLRRRARVLSRKIGQSGNEITVLIGVSVESLPSCAQVNRHLKIQRNQTELASNSYGRTRNFPRCICEQRPMEGYGVRRMRIRTHTRSSKRLRYVLPQGEDNRNRKIRARNTRRLRLEL